LSDEEEDDFQATYTVVHDLN